MKYFYVHKDKVRKGPLHLPVRWEGILEFDKLDLETLLEHGWYPAEKNHPVFDSKTEKQLDPIFIIEADKVISYAEIVAMTAQEINDNLQERIQLVQHSRQKRFREESNGLAFEWLVSQDDVDRDLWITSRDVIKAALPLPTE